jgi:hypothetical protein
MPLKSIHAKEMRGMNEVNTREKNKKVEERSTYARGRYYHQ